MAINAQMNRINILGMFHQDKVIISKFDALFNFSCLAGGLALTSFGRPINFNPKMKRMMMKIIMIEMIKSMDEISPYIGLSGTFRRR